MENVGKHGKSHNSYFKIIQGIQKNKQRSITLQQLSQHTNKQSAWLSLNGTVYDVTIYLNYHPGGSIMLQGCGKQCSQLFNKYHPWINAKHLLEKFKLGYLKL